MQFQFLMDTNILFGIQMNKKYNLIIKTIIIYEEMSMMFVCYLDINNDNKFKSYDVLLLDITTIEDYED